ncbi:glycosyltransferase family 4 protein [Brevundimonas sp.]|uniref:glycosyltransferase family 4 protein n=1 Tax=Brevundimonas sp. TaxID=1871086 RepID=UPI002FDABEBA
MKLLFAIKRLERASGGSERVLAHLTAALVRRGHAVTVLTWDAPDARPFYPLDPAVRLINRGVGDSARPTRPHELPARILDLRRTIMAQAPDVAIGFGHSMFVPLALALTGSGLPVIASEHGARAHYRDRAVDYALFRLAARLVRRVTVTTEAVGAEYTADVRRRMVVMPNPIMIAPPATSTRSGRLVLNVGRLEEQKDQALLIRAFARVAPRFSDWRLRILGEGRLRPELEALAAETGLGDRIALPGVTDDIVGAYAQADVFALSSSYESFGLATLEAMAQTLPVVGFADCPGTNEVVLDEQTGLLVQPGDDRVDAFAAGLERLMADAALRERLGAAGRARAEAMAGADDSADRWERLLCATAGLA